MLDYDNFKDAVAHRLNRTRARTYHRVWGACTEIQREEALDGPNERLSTRGETSMRTASGRLVPSPGMAELSSTRRERCSLANRPATSTAMCGPFRRELPWVASTLSRLRFERSAKRPAATQ